MRFVAGCLVLTWLIVAPVLIFVFGIRENPWHFVLLIPWFCLTFLMFVEVVEVDDGNV